jgi:nucleoside-diphosphate-sugar epimerase
MAKLIFGSGYLGGRVAQRWHKAGHEIVVVTRSRPRAEGFIHHGYGAIVADVTQPESLANLPTADTVLFAVGFDRTAGGTIDDVYAGGLHNVLGALPAETGRVIYISTTGVYGPAAGEWVDETTPPDPRRDGGRASLAAEQALTAHPLGKNGILLRLAGIYGPGRIPFLEKLRAGEPIPAPSAGYLNLIHVDDAASVIVAAGRLPSFNDGPRVYCVSDGHPVQRGEYYAEVARKIGGPAPTFCGPESNSPRAVRAESDRRIDNRRMVTELHVQLAYPDHRAGLAQILGESAFGCV